MKKPFSYLFRARDKPQNAVSAAPSFYFGMSGSGKSVSPSSAIQVSAVYACVRVIAETIASLPFHVYEATDEGSRKEWGIDCVDSCSYRAHQLMYWPTTPSNGEYVFERFDGAWLNPDAFLSAHPGWRDVSLLPTSSRESSVASGVRTAVNTQLTTATLRSAGVNAMAGLRAGILAGRSGVISAMRSAAREAVNAAKKELKIKSPSQVFRDEVGVMTMRGFGAGVLKESKAQARVIRNASRFLTGEAREGAIVQSSSDNRNGNEYSKSCVALDCGAPCFLNASSIKFPFHHTPSLF